MNILSNILSNIKSIIIGLRTKVPNSGTNPLAIAALFLAFCSLISCSDDLSYKSDSDGYDENFTGVTLMIPNVEAAAEFGATRSDGHANTRAYDEARDANFNTLYIAAIKIKDDKGEDLDTPTIQTFLKTSSNGEDEDGYSKYRVNLSPGYYRFYVVANLNRYTLNDAGENVTFADIAKTEQDIRDHILNFSANRPLEPGFLPMACLNEDIKVADTEGVSNAAKINSKDDLIKIEEKKTKYIYVDLTYLCAKVRYTILFDRSHTTFGSWDIIDVHRNVAEKYPYATNLREQTAIKDGSASLNFILDSDEKSSTWPIYLDRYRFPVLLDKNGNPVKDGDKDKSIYDSDESDDENIKYTLDHMTPWTSSMGEWAIEFKDKRAWQGVAYLPENFVGIDNSESLDPTLLMFPYSFNGAEGAESPRKIALNWENVVKGSEGYGIKRGKKYDVYVLITAPDPEQWTLTVIPEDWTLQNLAYRLHGPYELVVETTLIEELSMENDAIFWFRSDIPPSEIGFISPKVSASGETGSNMVDLFYGEVVKNKDGSYAKNENGDYLFRVRLNPDIPYKVIDNLNNGGLEYQGIKYTKKDVSYFHLIAGSLNKYIAIDKLNLDPYLIVDPQTIIIDTRELYTSGEDGATYPINITFETNVDLTDASYATLELSDPDNLIGDGKGDGSLKFVKEEIDALFTNNGSKYTYKDVQNKINSIVLRIKNIIYGNPYWDQNNQYNLTFTLTLHRTSGDVKIVKPVSIKIKPFSGTYVIHFRDNTKDWEQAHIYIFQDLTLPSNMIVAEQGTTQPYEHAGKIVGFIEYNPTSGFQWNAAVQYVFTNNLSFRGWYGSHKGIYKETRNGVKVYESDPDLGNEYGGTVVKDNYGNDIYNDPWAEAYFNASIPNGTETALTTSSPTYGFVMFGSPDKRTSHGAQHDFWNYDYSYNVTYDVDENPQRRQRYYYNVNFNSDHMNSGGDWNCWECSDQNAPDFNGSNDDRFYPGIAMEKEEDGWWKYTLTGVAQPGRSVIIFANWHEPWNPSHEWYDFRAEDYRWPGDYEAGLPLFDFEDNEGWFLFDGNTTNNDQQFTDNKPNNVIPHKFTPSYSNMSIQVKPSTIMSITVAGSVVSSSSEKDGIRTFNASDLDVDGKETIDVVAGGKTFTLAPKFFKTEGNGYITAQPLYTEYTEGIKLFVKWNDQIQPNPGYWSGRFTKELLYYTPPANGGSNYLIVYSESDGSFADVNKMGESHPFTAKEIGNYKYIDFTTLNPPGSVKDKLELRLSTTDVGSNNYYKVLNVEDLPQYYYPAEDKYQINWHFLSAPN